jgi:hypothetical protein
MEGAAKLASGEGQTQVLDPTRGQLVVGQEQATATPQRGLHFGPVTPTVGVLHQLLGVIGRDRNEAGTGWGLRDWFRHGFS